MTSGLRAQASSAPVQERYPTSEGCTGQRLMEGPILGCSCMEKQCTGQSRAQFLPSMMKGPLPGQTFKCRKPTLSRSVRSAASLPAPRPAHAAACCGTCQPRQRSETADGESQDCKPIIIKNEFACHVGTSFSVRLAGLVLGSVDRVGSRVSAGSVFEHIEPGPMFAFPLLCILPRTDVPGSRSQPHVNGLGSPCLGGTGSFQSNCTTGVHLMAAKGKHGGRGVSGALPSSGMQVAASWPHCPAGMAPSPRATGMPPSPGATGMPTSPRLHAATQLCLRPLWFPVHHFS